MLYVLIILLVTASVLLAVYSVRSSRQKKHQERVEIIEREIPDVGPAFKDISSFYSYGHYITESERQALDSKYSDLLTSVKKVISSKELEGHPEKENVERFFKAMSDTPGYKKINNEEFVKKQLWDYAGYFDTVLPYPLDAQQREAVVSLEDNVLVISSAGSGKTMTTVGKVRYLIDVQKVDPSKILLITFTHKASESLSERLGEKNLKCRTFHKLALEIIGEATGEKPTIVPQDFSVQVYHRLFDNNPTFHRAIADYIIRARYKMKDQFEYSSMEAYMLDRKKYGVIPGITDREYYTNSNHVPVYYHCSALHKAQIEAPYHDLTRGGHIFYVEIDGDATHNPEVVMNIVDLMDKYNIGYGSVNHTRNRCMDCGYENAEKHMDTCPKCGSHNVDRLQRITGYLVGTTDRWNKAKLAELNDRVVHD